MIRSTHYPDDASVDALDTTVYVVDADAPRRGSTVDLIRSWSQRAEAYESAETFLSAYDHSQPGCVVTRDVLPGMSGVQLLDHLRAHGSPLPVIVLADQADVRTAVEVMQHGALTLLPKGTPAQAIHEAVDEAFERNRHDRAKIARQHELQSRLSRLSPVESEVLELMIAGKANKNIARQQAVSLRTVETRRQQVFQKMEADSLAELIRMVFQARTGETLPEQMFAEATFSRIQ